MAFPAFISKTAAVATGNVGSLAITYPASIAAGDDLFVLVAMDQDDASGSTLTGFTLIEEEWINAGSQSVYAALFHKIAAGSESGSVTITFGGGASDTASAVMVRVSGGTGTRLSSASQEGATTAPAAPGNVLDDGGDYLVFDMWAMDGPANYYSADPSGFTNWHNSGNDSSLVSLSVASNEITGDGSTVYGDEAHTTTVGRQTIAFSIAIKGESASVPVEVEPEDASHAMESGRPALSRIATGTPESSAHAIESGRPAIARLVTITPEEASHGLESGRPVLARLVTVSPEDASHALASGRPDVDTGTVDLSAWSPVAGYDAYVWQEGAAWTDIDIVVDLGLSEASNDIGPAIKAHLDANAGSRIRYTIPPGKFQLKTLLLVNRDEKRIEGAGYGLTLIETSGAGVIRFQGFDGSTTDITAAPSRGDTVVSVVSAAVAAVNETITIKQTLDATVTGVDDNTSPYALGTITPEVWAAQAWEQIVRVTAVDTGANTITFEPALALDYDDAKDPQVKRYNNVFDAGIGNLTIRVLEDTGLVALQFDRVRQCYAKNLRIFDHAKMGIQVTESFEVEIGECAVIGARDTGTGGNGYGYCLELGTARVYLHDSMAKDQRHAFLIQSGASHNIIGYCYSASASLEDLTDLSLHGHFVHHNLIEGSIFHGTVEVNDFYTETNFNLLYRNRILGNAAFWDSASRPYSFWVRRNSKAAFVGNRCETTEIARVFAGSEGSFFLKNGAADTDSGLADSMYLGERPASWDLSFVWPPFAGDTVNTIPAQGLDVGPVTIDPEEASHALEGGASAIARLLAIAPASSAHALASGRPDVSTLLVIEIAPEDASHASESTRPALSRFATVAPASSAHALESGRPVIARLLAISPEGSAHALESGRPFVSTLLVIEIEPEDASHASESTRPAVSRIVTAAPGSASHALEGGAAAIARLLAIAPEDASHALASGRPDVSTLLVIEIAPEDASHASESTRPAVSRLVALTPEDASHALAGGAPAIARLLGISPENSAHLHTVTESRVILGFEVFADDPIRVRGGRRIIRLIGEVRRIIVK